MVVFGLIRSTIPDELRNVSNVNGGSMYYPPDDILRRYRVIVCTMVTAARWVCVCAHVLGIGLCVYLYVCISNCHLLYYFSLFLLSFLVFVYVNFIFCPLFFLVSLYLSLSSML